MKIFRSHKKEVTHLDYFYHYSFFAFFLNDMTNASELPKIVSDSFDLEPTVVPLVMPILPFKELRSVTP